MSADDKIRSMIEPAAEDLGFEIVRVTYGGGRRPTLQIMAERADGTMTVDDCARLSRELSLVLDAEDPLPGEYVLEVSSPGIDRPLTRLKDFERWAGFDAKIELQMQQDGRRRFRGQIVSVDGGSIAMAVDGDMIHIVHSDVAKAKLILTDALIAAVTPAGGDATPHAAADDDTANDDMTGKIRDGDGAKASN